MSLSDELESLAKLHAQGTLSDLEYAAAKANLLGLKQGPSTVMPPFPSAPTQPHANPVAAQQADFDRSYGPFVGILGLAILVGYALPWVTFQPIGGVKLSVTGFDIIRMITRIWSSLNDVGVDSGFGLGWLVLAFSVTIFGSLVATVAGFARARVIAGNSFAGMWCVWLLVIVFSLFSNSGSSRQGTSLTAAISREIGTELTAAALEVVIRTAGTGPGLWLVPLAALVGLVAAGGWNARSRSLAQSGSESSGYGPPTGTANLLTPPNTPSYATPQPASHQSPAIQTIPAIPTPSILAPPPSTAPNREHPTASAVAVTSANIGPPALHSKESRLRTYIVVSAVWAAAILIAVFALALRSTTSSARRNSTHVSGTQVPPAPASAPAPIAQATTPASPDTRCDVPLANESFDAFQRRCGGSSEPAGQPANMDWWERQSPDDFRPCPRDARGLRPCTVQCYLGDRAPIPPGRLANGDPDFSDALRRGECSAPQAAPPPGPSGVRCRLVEESSFHLRPTATAARGGSTAYPAGVSVEVLAATNVRRGRTEEMFRVRVIHDGAIGYMFLTEEERTQCGDWGDGRYTLDRN